MFGDENLRIFADDVSIKPVEAVCGLRKAARQRHTRNLILEKSHQGVDWEDDWLLPGRHVEGHGSPGILPYVPLLPRLEITS